MHKRTWEEAYTNIWDEEPTEEPVEKFSELIQAIIIAHSMKRLLKGFEPHERNKAVETVMQRLYKFLKQRERTNLKDFIFATEFERTHWQQVTDDYDKSTPLYAINTAATLCDYFDVIMNRYAKLSPKVMEKFGITHNNNDSSREECFMIEQNDGSFVSTYIEKFEPFSGVSVRKSPFAGRKLTIKNNLIIEGKKIAEEFE